MRRRLWLLNLLLLAGVVWCGWHMRETWRQARAREQILLAHRLPALEVTTPTIAPPAAPVTPAIYFDVAQKLLFSKDRNPDVYVEPPAAPPPPPPWPPMPTVYGYMDFGGNPIVLMSEKQGAPQKGYHKGDDIGQMKIIDLDSKTITFEFDHRQETKRYDELIARGPAPAEQAAASAPPAGPANTAASSLTGSTQNANNAKPNGGNMQNSNENVRPGPGTIQTSETTRACSGDTLPAGTVQEGYRKVVTSTPFGNRCEWQLVK